MLVDAWSEYAKLRKLYEVNPLEYLKAIYGYVPIDKLKNIVGLDEMISDSSRMQADLDKQKKEFENKMKKSGRDFNRL